MKNILESLVEKKTNHKAICPDLHCPGLLCPGMLKGGVSKGQENSFVLSSLELFVTQARRRSYTCKLA